MFCAWPFSISDFRRSIYVYDISRFVRAQQLASADMFDVEAQRQIEEEIRMKNVNENMEMAMEFMPESFARVVMLYGIEYLSIKHWFSSPLPPFQPRLSGLVCICI